MKKIKIGLIAACMFLCVTCLFACTQNSATTSNTSQTKNNGIQTHNGYTLEQVTILSRHNMRAANEDTKPNYKTITPHTWVDWTANSSELTLQGGEEETFMGQYFRKFLTNQNFMPENWEPENNQVYFFSNSNQRTIATANYFAAGMLPMVNVDIKHNLKIGENDPLFRKALSIDKQEFRDQVKKEIIELSGSDSEDAFNSKFANEFKTLDKILDFKDSEYAQKNNVSSIADEKTSIELKNGSKPSIKGPLYTSCSAVDALRFQYYMTTNDKEAFFGHDISYNDFKAASKLEDIYLKGQYGTKTGSIDMANPTLVELQKQMKQKDRKFTFICGHDTTIIAVLSALRAKDYELPNAIEAYAPIGSKLLIQKFKAADGQEYCTLSLVYASVDQLRNQTIISMDNPPMEVQLELEGLQKNADGLYKYSDVEKRFTETIAEYDKLSK